MKNQLAFKDLRTKIKYWDHFDLDLYYRILKARK